MTETSGVLSRLRASVGARPGEGAVLVWATAYYFLVLCAYYVIRPIRDDMGAASGAENLAWLFTGTMVGMLLVHPLYTKLVSTLRRRAFIAWTYRFFILNLVAFYIAFRVTDPAQAIWIGRIFFIWTSIFNLFVVSVFWSLLTDVFSPRPRQTLVWRRCRRWYHWLGVRLDDYHVARWRDGTTQLDAGIGSHS